MKDLAEVSEHLGSYGVTAVLSKALVHAIPAEPDGDQFADFVELDERADLPSFPIGALPEWVTNWALAAADAEQVPLDHALSLGLAALSTAVMGKAKVAIWSEPLNLYLLLIDRSGANKSGVYKAALGPIEAYAARAERDDGGELAAWKATLEAAESRLKGATMKLAKAGKKLLPTDTIVERELAQSEAEAAAREVHRLEGARPQGGLRFCGDVTPEMFAMLLAQNHAVALHSAEGAEVFEGMGRYQKNAENMDTLLKAWKGDFLRIDRKSGTHIVKACPCAGLVAMAQPTVLGGLRDPDGKREGRGVLGRFLYVVPQSKVGSRTPTRGMIDPIVSEAYRAGLARLLAMPYPAQVNGQANPPIIEVSREAWGILESFYLEIEKELRPAGDLVDVESFASKIRSALVRIAGILHLANGAAVSDAIDQATMGRALEVTRFFLAHGKAAHGMMETDSANGLALRLFAKIAEAAEAARAKSEDGAVPFRELAQSIRGAKAFKSADAVKGILAMMLGPSGYVCMTKRGSKDWILVNPVALTAWRRRHRMS